MSKGLLKYISPTGLYRNLRSFFRKQQGRKLGIAFYPPNYVFLDKFNRSSTILDIGCGYKAEFAQLLVERYRLNAAVIDPTQKHSKALMKIVKDFKPHIKYLNYAVSSKNGFMEFHETLDNESGSLLSNHRNILTDRVRSYKVKSITLDSLRKELKLKIIDLVKLDLEGAEYGLIKSFNRNNLEAFQQLFIEFHHHAFSGVTRADTKKAVEKIKRLGFQSFTLDNHNYLFYRG